MQQGLSVFLLDTEWSINTIIFSINWCCHDEELFISKPDEVYLPFHQFFSVVVV